ncbi:MAG: hypothetical protein Q8P18_34730 [Pseudomonadota bacterium]|nr:hypothetical protein [Pseudomonadota bacterium]
MFDSVGRATSRSPRRRVGALLLSLVFNGGAVGALTWLGGRAIEEVKEVEAVLERPIELVLPARGAPSLAAPAAAKPRARAQAAAPVVPPPEVVTSVTPVVPPLVVPPVALLAATSDDGTADATLPGKGGGRGGTGGGGGGGGEKDGPGSSGGGIKVVHWTEAAVKVRADVRPSDYPAAASALNLPDTRCVVRIHIDERGAPYEVVPKACPEVFRVAAQNVAMRYRFYPVREGTRAVRAGFDLTIHFRDE